MKARQERSLADSRLEQVLPKPWKKLSIDLFGRNGWRGQKSLALEAISDLQTSTVMTYFCNLTEATSELAIARSIAKVIGIHLTIQILLLSWERYSLPSTPSWYWTTLNMC